ncbi:MAG TPA: hypothetical protein VGI75_02390 [Pirellulales bacterium]|jgi:hypothetical protein
MFEAFTKMFERIEPEAFFGLMIPLTAVTGSMIVGIVALITKHLRSVRQREIDAMLKQDMIARGMSAGEIERVLAAKSIPESKSSR